MNITTIILTTLIACDGKADDSEEVGSGSYDTCYGEPMIPSDFSLTADVSAKSTAALLQQYGLSAAEELTCAQLCEHVVNNQQYSSLNNIDTCTHTIGEDDGAATAAVSCSGQSTYYCEGRRPLGHIEADTAEADRSLGGFLAHCAHLEAASVSAFEQLARQLTDRGAPASLVRRCREAALEEQDHAQAMDMLARRHGGAVVPAVHSLVAEDLETIATHNAVEGCVAETWAALSACWKGRHATDPTLRAVYARIAVDELRHAGLAWDLHTWLLSRLDADARARIEAAQVAAIAALPDLAAQQARSTPDALGMPSGPQAAAMAKRFRQGLLRERRAA